jgi:predicted alpha/beta superfamily hydrolase
MPRRTKVQSLLDKAIALSEALAELDTNAALYMKDYHQKKVMLENQLNKVMTTMFQTRKKEWKGVFPSNNNKRAQYTA